MLTNIVETVTDVKRSSDDLLKISAKVLAKTQNQEIYFTNEYNVLGLPDVDLGKRSSNLTDSQKEYLITVGPHQPVLPGWYKEYPHSEVYFG